MFINGEWVGSESKKTFETLNPENNEPWAVVPEASAKDVNNAVNAAQKAFEGDWPKLLPKERAKFLRMIGQQLRDNAEMLGEIETIDTGKIIRELKNKQFILLTIMIIMQALQIKLKEQCFQLISQTFKQ